MIARDETTLLERKLLPSPQSLAFPCLKEPVIGLHSLVFSSHNSARPEDPVSVHPQLLAFVLGAPSVLSVIVAFWLTQ